jgi:hypothetical protein
MRTKCDGTCQTVRISGPATLYSPGRSMVKRTARGMCSCDSARESSATQDGEGRPYASIRIASRFLYGILRYKRNRLLYQCQPTGQFSVRLALQGRDVVVGLTLEQTQSHLCCALFVCSRGSPMAPFRDVAKLRCLRAQLFQLVQATVPTALVPRRGIRRAEVFMCQDKFRSTL